MTKPTRSIQDVLGYMVPSRHRSKQGGDTLDEASKLAGKRSRELREAGKMKNLAPQYTQDGVNEEPVVLDSILSHLTDAPIEQTYPLKKKLAWDASRALAFALDCAGRVLPVFREAYPREVSVPLLFEVARRYSRGKATDKHVALALKKVHDFASTMPDHWSAAGEAAGAIYAAATGDIATAAASAREAQFGSAGGPREHIDSDTEDPYTTPGAPPDKLGDAANARDHNHDFLEHFTRDTNNWNANRDAALKLRSSEVLVADAKERDWQLQRLQEYLEDARQP